MGMMDKAKDMKDKAAQSGKADEAIDKAADVADEKTEGKYGDKIDEGADKAKEAMQQPNEQ
jgi:hypothetical protein